MLEGNSADLRYYGVVFVIIISLIGSSIVLFLTLKSKLELSEKGIKTNGRIAKVKNLGFNRNMYFIRFKISDSTSADSLMVIINSTMKRGGIGDEVKIKYLEELDEAEFLQDDCFNASFWIIVLVNSLLWFLLFVSLKFPDTFKKYAKGEIGSSS